MHTIIIKLAPKSMFAVPSYMHGFASHVTTKSACDHLAFTIFVHN